MWKVATFCRLHDPDGQISPGAFGRIVSQHLRDPAACTPYDASAQSIASADADPVLCRCISLRGGYSTATGVVRDASSPATGSSRQPSTTGAQRQRRCAKATKPRRPGAPCRCRPSGPSEFSAVDVTGRAAQQFVGCSAQTAPLDDVAQAASDFGCSAPSPACPASHMHGLRSCAVSS